MRPYGAPGTRAANEVPLYNRCRRALSDASCALFAAAIRAAFVVDTARAAPADASTPAATSSAWSTVALLRARVGRGGDSAMGSRDDDDPEGQ